MITVSLVSPEIILIDTALFIIDKAPTQPKYALETEDRVLHFLTGKPNVPFGGKIFVLGGDQRQTLPVVPRVINMAIREYCIFASYLWEHYQVFHLNINNRIQPDEQEFAHFILQLGDDNLPQRDNPQF